MRKLNEQPLRDVLREMVETYRLKSRLQQTRIKSLWADTMGQAIANYTTEIKLSRGGKLYIAISSAALRQELSYGKEKIRNIFNEELGEEAIKEVVIR